MSFSSSWRYGAAICLLFATFVFMTAGSVYAGGRLGERRSCLQGDGWVPCNPPRSRPKPPKPDPEKENQARVLEMLHSAFAEEEKTYGSGFAAYLTNPSGGPYVVTLANMQNLRRINPTANAKDLEYFIFSLNNKDKPSFVKSTGIEDWIAAFVLPKITGFSPESGIVGDEITVKGENLGAVAGVKFLSAKAPFTVVSNNEIKVKFPEYVGSARFPIEVITQFGSVKSATQFRQLTGECEDKDIPRAIYELNLRSTRGEGTTGECDPARYGNYKSYNQLIKVMAEKYGFVRREPPKITAIPILSGGVGASIRIDGNNLYQVKMVVIGNTPVDYYTSQADHTILATVPATSGKIAVVTYSGFDIWPADFTVLAPPKADSITPREIVVDGTFRVTGQNFDDKTTVNPGTLMARTPTELIIKMSSPRTNETIHISTGGGETNTPFPVTVWSGICDNFLITKAFRELLKNDPLGSKSIGQCNPKNYINGNFRDYDQLKFAIRQRYGYVSRPAPTIISIDPAQPVAGEDVWIYGTNFYNVQSVIFGSNSAEDYKVHSDTKIRAKVRFGSGSGDVIVGTLENVARFPLNLLYPPYIGGVNPKEALPGATVHLSGKGFGKVTSILFNDTQANIQSQTDNDLVVSVPKGLTGKVAIQAIAGKTVGRWEPFGIVTARLQAPEGKLRNLRLEIIGPDGKLRGSAALVGNSGVSFGGDALDKLIGNAGAGLTGNTPLTGNSPLIGNAGAGLSINEISSLIGNAGAGLIGNAGAGLNVSLGNLIGNAGAGLSDAAVKNLIGNAGAGLIGNAGAGLAGNAGSSLIGNAGAGLVDTALSLVARKPADLLVIDIKNLAGNAGSSLKLPIGIVNIAPPKIDLSVGVGVGLQRYAIHGLKEKPAADRYQLKPASPEQTGTVPTKAEIPKRVSVPVETKPAPASEPVKPAAEPKPALKPAPEPIKTQPAPAPAVEPKVVPPPAAEATKPSPAPTPAETKPSCPAGSTYSFTFGICMEDAPQKLSPYDGLPCPDNVESIPSYATKGCIPQS